MIEFGSDFHFIDTYNSRGAHLTDLFRDVTLLADGRQCIVVLIRQYGWKRIWISDYFCYEVIDTIKEQTGIEVMFYKDNPLHEGQVENLPFEEGDVLLRMNFFGIRGWRNNKKITCPVIEDHTHDLLGQWALYSDADWCIASIRKSLPLPEGGMMWSPKGHKLAVEVQPTDENDKIAADRWGGMEMKARYLNGTAINKDEFRKCFTETEDWFDKAETAMIDNRSRRFVSKQLDINLWQGAKRRNWSLLKSLVKCESCKALEPEDDNCTMFSLILLFDTKVQRDLTRKQLIEASVYPAVLWAVSESASEESREFSERMLSVHCDGRYSEEAIKQLAKIINDNVDFDVNDEFNEAGSTCTPKSHK